MPWASYGTGDLTVKEGTNKGQLPNNAGSTNESRSNFSLDDGNWVALQVWAEDVSTLPGSRSLMKDYLDPSHSVDYPEDEFDPLIGLYTQMQETVRDFTGYNEDGKYVRGAYDDVVDTSQLIVNYANFVQTYYAGIGAEITEIVDDILSGRGDIAALKNRLLRRLSRIKEKADETHERADSAYQRTVTIHADVTKQKEDLEEQQTHYKSKYAIEDKDLKELRQRIRAKQAEIAQDNADYSRDVGLAAGLGPGLFIFVWWAGGCIAGPIISGVFGDKAVKALNELHKDEGELAKLQSEELFKISLHTVLDTSNQKLDNLHKDFEGAKQSLGKLRDVWKTLSGDLDQLHSEVLMMDDDAKEAPDMLISLSQSDPGDLDMVLQDWQQVGNDAQTFVANAHVTFSHNVPSLPAAPTT